MPSNPCTYVITIVDELKNFLASQQKSCSLAVMRSRLGNSCDSILGLYLVQVQDVLINVSKMEESLKKLKKVKERGGVLLGKIKQ